MNGFDELLSDCSDQVAGLARHLSASISEAFPDVESRYYVALHGLAFIHPEARRIAMLFPTDAGVVAYIEHGAFLPDVHGLLEGGERLRQTRTLQFDPDLTMPAVEHLIDYLDLEVEFGIARRRR